MELTMRFGTKLIFAFAILMSGSALSAQTPRQLEVSSRVRITQIVGAPILGQVLNPGGESISLLESRTGIQISVARSNIYRMQMKVKGKRGPGAIKGGMLGLVGGALVGGLLGAASYRPSSESICIMACSTGESAAMGATVLGAGGLLLGLVIGASAGGDRWVDVPVRR
jgi:hypothetical protein